MNAYIERVLEIAKKRDAGEPEFIQTVEEVLNTLAPAIEKHPEYEKAGLLERLIEPERSISFRVTWLMMLVKSKSTVVTEFSSMALLALIRAVCAFGLMSIPALSNFWPLNKLLKTA